MNLSHEVWLAIFVVAGFLTGVSFGGAVGYIAGLQAGKRKHRYGG